MKKGDTLRISEDNASPGEVTVGGIVENYLNHYVIMTPELYRKTFQEDPVYNQLLILNQEGVSVSSEELGNEYMNEKAFITDFSSFYTYNILQSKKVANT